jgi:hypothetical protein
MNPQHTGKQTSGLPHPATPPELAAQASLFALHPTLLVGSGEQVGTVRMAMRSTDTLKPHPSLLKQKLQPAIERHLALEKLGEVIFEQPLLITQDNLIVDGYARWLIACRQQRATMLCQVCQLTEQEALQRILQTHRRPEWLNAFSRVQLALDLEPWFREKARVNQSAGGKEKASSKLTEDRRLDCRKQIAEAAGVCTGNVTKVKQILCSSMVRVGIEALRSGEISIHRAWLLSKLSIREQEAELGNRIARRRTNQRIRKLLSRHISKSGPVADSLRYLRRGLTGLKDLPFMDSHSKEINKLLDTIEREFTYTRRSPFCLLQVLHASLILSIVRPPP